MGAERPWEPSRRARRRALQAVYQWLMTAQEPEEIVRQFHENQNFGNVDVSLFERLTNGVASDRDALVSALQPALDRPFDDCDVMERALLLLGAWQLRHQPELPWQVAINETVDLAHRFGSDQSPGFVNAVLDRAARSWRGAADQTPHAN